MALRDDHLDDIRAIWDAAVEAANPKNLAQFAVTGDPFELKRRMKLVRSAPRILVVGGGKAAAAMAAGLQESPFVARERFEGLVNIPQGSERNLQKIELHVARPAGSNYPTAEGV